MKDDNNLPSDDKDIRPIIDISFDLLDEEEEEEEKRKSTEISLDILDDEEEEEKVSVPIIDINIIDEEEAEVEDRNVALVPTSSVSEPTRTLSLEVVDEQGALTVLEESFPDSVLEFFSRPVDNNDDVVFFDDEETAFQDPTEEQETRIGVRESVEESATQILGRYANSLESLKRVSASGNSYAREDSVALGRIMHLTSLSFLTASQQSKLLLLVSTIDDRKLILKDFLESYNLSSGNKIKLSNAVDKILIEYSEYKRRHEILRGMSVSSGDLNFDTHMEQAQNDLEEIRQNLEKNNLYYVSKIIKRTEGVDFVCGNCGEVSRSDHDFINIVVHEKLGDRDAYLQVFPRGCTCSNCNGHNMLTNAEHSIISNKLNATYNAQLSKWFSSNNRKLSSGVNIISYVPETSRLLELYPALYEAEKKEETVNEEVSLVNLSTMYKWYEETKDLMSLLKTSYGKGEGGTDYVDGKFIPKKEDQFDALYAVAKMYCQMFSEDFDLLRANATNTILLYLKEHSGLITSLSVTSTVITETRLSYKNYLGKKLDKQIYESVASELDIDYNFESPLWKVDIPVILEKKFSELENELVSEKESHAKAVKSLDSLLPLFMFIEISSVSRPDIEDIKGALVVPEVKQFVERLSLLLIINRISPKALDLWKTLTIPGYKNASLFNPNTKKPFPELLTKMFKSYTEYYSDKGPKSNFLLISELFLSANWMSRSILSIMYDIRAGIEKGDMYSFYEAVLKLKPYKESYKFLEEFARVIDVQAKKALEFFEDRESEGLLDYYLFHYGHLFSKEEIESSLLEIKERFKQPFEIDRDEGETFFQYIEKVKVTKYDSTIHKVDERSLFYVEFKHILPAVYGLFEYSRAYTSYGDKAEHYIFMNDLILYANVLGSKHMYEFLGLIAPTVEVFEGSEDKGLVLIDEESYKVEVAVKSLIFPSTEVNFLASGGSEEISDIFDLIDKEPDIVASSLDLLGDLGGIIREHYFS